MVCNCRVVSGAVAARANTRDWRLPSARVYNVLRVCDMGLLHTRHPGAYGGAVGVPAHTAVALVSYNSKITLIINSTFPIFYK